MYIVIELQTNGGVTGNFVFAFTDIADAYAKYYTILSVAAKSSVEVHAAIILDETGKMIANEHFAHEKAVEETEVEEVE